MTDELENGQVGVTVGQGPGAGPIDAPGVDLLEQGVELHRAVGEDARLPARQPSVDDLEIVPDQDLGLEPFLQLVDEDLEGPGEQDDAASLFLEAEDLRPQVL